jgi:flagellar protein FlgJ
MIQSVPSSTLAATADAKATAEQTKLKSAAQAFEAVFLRQMIGSMRQAGLGDGMLDNDASNQFRDIADSKMADSMAQKGVLGIADMLLKQIGPIAAKTAGGNGAQS